MVGIVLSAPVHDDHTAVFALKSGQGQDSSISWFFKNWRQNLKNRTKFHVWHLHVFKNQWSSSLNFNAFLELGFNGLPQHTNILTEGFNENATEERQKDGSDLHSHRILSGSRGLLASQALLLPNPPRFLISSPDGCMACVSILRDESHEMFLRMDVEQTFSDVHFFWVHHEMRIFEKLNYKSFQFNRHQNWKSFMKFVSESYNLQLFSIEIPKKMY